MSQLAFIRALMQVTRSRWEMIKHDERGEVTEKVIIIAIFAGLAIAAGAIIVAKVMEKANAIPTQ